MLFASCRRQYIVESLRFIFLFLRVGTCFYWLINTFLHRVSRIFSGYIFDVAEIWWFLSYYSFQIRQDLMWCCLRDSNIFDIFWRQNYIFWIFIEVCFAVKVFSELRNRCWYVTTDTWMTSMKMVSDARPSIWSWYVRQCSMWPPSHRSASLCLCLTCIR